mgnify:CR=1 FL=1
MPDCDYSKQVDGATVMYVPKSLRFKDFKGDDIGLFKIRRSAHRLIAFFGPFHPSNSFQIEKLQVMHFDKVPIFNFGNMGRIERKGKAKTGKFVILKQRALAFHA